MSQHLISLLDHIDANIFIQMLPDEDAYYVRLGCKTEIGPMVIRQKIEGSQFISWGKDYTILYMSLIVDGMIDDMFEELYDTHGQGD